MSSEPQAFRRLPEPQSFSSASTGEILKTSRKVTTAKILGIDRVVRNMSPTRNTSHNVKKNIVTSPERHISPARQRLLDREPKGPVWLPSSTFPKKPDQTTEDEIAFTESYRYGSPIYRNQLNVNETTRSPPARMKQDQQRSSKSKTTNNRTNIKSSNLGKGSSKQYTRTYRSAKELLSLIDSAVTNYKDAEEKYHRVLDELDEEKVKLKQHHRELKTYHQKMGVLVLVIKKLMQETKSSENINEVDDEEGTKHDLGKIIEKDDDDENENKTFLEREIEAELERTFQEPIQEYFLNDTSIVNYINDKIENITSMIREEND